MKIVCDTHVHCYQFEQLASLLDAANHNLSQQGDSDAKLLFFTDGVKDPTWQTLLPKVKAGDYYAGDWKFDLFDNERLIVAKKGGATLFLAPAKQVNSAKRIEFLILGCAESVEDGIVEAGILDQFADPYAVVCPWGVGKWLGSRGLVMEELIKQRANQFLLGDNGGRPKLWSKVSHFAQHPLSTLNGSDPLPLRGEIARVGKFGVCFNIHDKELTLNAVLSAIKSGNHRNYGKGMGLFQFLKLQIGLRLSS